MDIIPIVPQNYFNEGIFRNFGIGCCYEDSTLEQHIGCEINIETAHSKMEQTSEANIEKFEKLDEWKLDSLIEYMVTNYHKSAKDNIITIYDLAEKISFKHGAKHPELQKLTAFLFLLFDDLLSHFKMEEDILFKNILQLLELPKASDLTTNSGFWSIKKSITAMKKDHEATFKDLRFLRVLTSNYMIPVDGCVSYKFLFEIMRQFEDDLIRHICIENNILFVKAIELDEKVEEQKLQVL
ncbi:MAG: hemerythrin domain-containing protein [Flavisolibacter sp.]